MSLRRLWWLASLALAVACGSLAQTPDADTRRLLDAVDRAVRDDLTRQKQQLASERKALELPSPPPAPAMSRDEVERERKLLLAKVEEWSTSSAVLVDITVRSREINDVFARSESVARFYGVDVARFRRVYELGKKIVRESAFEVPDRPLPQNDGRLSAYFASFFREAALLEGAIAEASRRNQDYRVGLFKKVTFAYLRALLKSGEQLPDCRPTSMNKEVRLGGRTIRAIGCPDPMLAELRAYIDGLRTIQSAEIEALAAESEKLIAEQQLAADILSVVPVVGDAVDIYQAYMNETLAGQCMSPFERGLTALFTAVPLVGPTLFQQAVKRSDRAALAAQKLDAYFEHLAGQGAEAIEGFAARHQILAENVRGLLNFLQGTRIEIEFPGRVSPDASLPAELEKKFQANKTIYETLRAAEEGQVALRSLPADFRERAVAESRRVLAQNLEAVQRGRAGAVQASNMVAAHLDAIEEVARQRREILIFRHVNPDATRLIEQHYLTKGMNVKGKSADWGPQRGFIPVDQSLSKLGNPAHAKLDEVVKFQQKIEECLREKCAFKVDLKRPDGSRVMVVPDPASGVPTPVVLKDGAYLHPDTGTPLNLTQAQLSQVKPLEVLAGYDPNGVLVPLTADYDFLAVGRKSDVRSPGFDAEKGFVSGVDPETIAAVNRGVQQRAGFQGGNVAHHGAEAWFPDSPGALKQDPLVTVVDPDRGLLSIPRCDDACMRKWCDTTGQCRGVPLCSGVRAAPPCIPVDPDRLLKDYFHAKRLEGYNLFPNSAWDWGNYNVLGGWTMNKFLANPGVSRFLSETMALRAATRRAMMAGSRMLGSLFSCESQQAEPAR
jgi:hypothetical protein